MITVFLKGRIGNQMFQYSVCRLLAEKKGFNFYIPTHDDIIDRYSFFKRGEKNLGDFILVSNKLVKILEFLKWSNKDSCQQFRCIESDGTVSTIFSHDPLDGIHMANFFTNLNYGIEDGEIKTFLTEGENLDIDTIEDFSIIDGYLQWADYLEDNRTEVKNWFKLDLNETAKVITEKYPISEYCYIHLRAGDLKNYGHWFLNKDYYEKAMNYMKHRYYGIKFLIITDDLEEAKNSFPDIESVSNDQLTDFLLLSHAKIIVTSNSTFSWWAAWLNDSNTVVSPSNWLNYNKPELGFYPLGIKTERFIYI